MDDEGRADKADEGEIAISMLIAAHEHPEGTPQHMHRLVVAQVHAMIALRDEYRELRHTLAGLGKLGAAVYRDLKAQGLQTNVVPFDRRRERDRG